MFEDQFLEQVICSFRLWCPGGRPHAAEGALTGTTTLLHTLVTHTTAPAGEVSAPEGAGTVVKAV
ncbi:hypothetical protein [Sinosporangium siamense]|uniref:Uncharacterized protein n=2 Tax=Sinosporangium siamense TaxID=1367973 RepID=A0A919V8G3_9ACTN|nr:hypothetical protein [Sinosporangium siamense]GII94428.1 hypothetical protein Ssi02_46590 [Sinosporangium siamense]